ncbi:MAG: phosphoribosylformylglycinamidine synthase subunit PurS [Ignavibacteriae bacterium]|nr:phosphoribosylformylglycinamidine synthase subunit PurS [Ignavibacteriota bacterium]
MFHAKIVVTLRKSILDPQGKAVEHGIHSLGYKNAKNVRIGKFVEMKVEASSKQEAERIVQEACQKLLANPVMEDFTFTLEEVHAQKAHV